MAMRINTNVAALKATRNLNVTTNRLSKSLNRLSTGLKINSAADGASALVAQHGMIVTAISPGVFKCAPVEEQIEEHLARMGPAVDACLRFGAGTMVAFTIQSDASDAKPPSLVVDAIARAGRIAQDAGVRIALENEPGYSAVGARGLANLIEAVGMENVGANWDPGNAWPYDPDIDSGPAILGDRVFNVHVKDTTERDGQREFDVPGEGSINWPAQIEGLRAIGYDGPIVVETHCQPRFEKTRASVAAVKELLAK